MTRVASNSSNTRRRIRHFLHSEAQIIYPPCATTQFQWQGISDYYISTARLEPYKRIDLIVDAFLQMPDKKLVIVSGGSDETKLRRRARGAENITFTGWVSRAGMAGLLANSIASIYVPKDEDFGLSPVESMAAGKPVIGVAEGGLKESVIDGRTGILLPPDPPMEAIVNAVKDLTPKRASGMRAACEAQARFFGIQRFRQELLGFVGAD